MAKINPKIFVRVDQTIDLVGQSTYQDENVKIFAPEWVKTGLKHSQVKKCLPQGSRFEVVDKNNKKIFLITENEVLSLKELVAIARNEAINATGSINFSNYLPLIDNQSVIYSLKDLARQCVIIGFDETTHFGGYKTSKIPQVNRVLVVDLIGLQFQQAYNSGRLILVSKDKKFPSGILDDLIFEKIVGEKKKSYEECQEDERFHKNGDVFFDSLAYKKFVAADVLLIGLALNKFTNEEINLKFLKYGAGNLSGQFSDLVNKYINDGVAEGLKMLLPQQKLIKQIELPFFEINQTIVNICKEYCIECVFSCDDALESTNKNLITTTTTCSDPHVVFGNEMRFKSIGAAIAENLKSRGNKFSPVINKLIQEKYIDINIRQQSSATKPLNSDRPPEEMASRIIRKNDAKKFNDQLTSEMAIHLNFTIKNLDSFKKNLEKEINDNFLLNSAWQKSSKELCKSMSIQDKSLSSLAKIANKVFSSENPEVAKKSNAELISAIEAKTLDHNRFKQFQSLMFSQKKPIKKTRAYKGVATDRFPIGQVGSFVTSKQFEIFSSKMSTAQKFAERGTLYVITTDNAIIVDSPSGAPEEREVVIAPGQIGRIAWIRRDRFQGKVYWEVHLVFGSAVGDNSKPNVIEDSDDTDQLLIDLSDTKINQPLPKPRKSVTFK